MTLRSVGSVGLLVAVWGGVLGGCGTAQTQRAEGSPTPGSLAYDKAVFHQLLEDHAKVRRVLTLTPTGVEAVTESDDPTVAARIKDHTLAMQTRMKSGDRVRAWDPVFADLFDNHDKVALHVTLTEKGVAIKESSADPEVVALLHSHASGVSGFVRQGPAASADETPRLVLVGGTRTVVALGSLPHHFDRAQPDEADMAASRDAGIKGIIDFRKASEHADFDEKAVAERLGLAYVNIPYQGAAELSDEVLDASRKAFASMDGGALMHCRSGNRVGAAWLPYRVLDGGLSWDDALAEAKAVGLKDEKLEAKAKAYIEKHQPAK